MFKTACRRRRLALEHQELAMPLPRKRSPQLERHDEFVEATGDIVERLFVIVRKTLDQTSVAEEGLGGVVIMLPQLADVLENRPNADSESREIGSRPFHDGHVLKRRELLEHE